MVLVVEGSVIEEEPRPLSQRLLRMCPEGFVVRTEIGGTYWRKGEGQLWHPVDPDTGVRANRHEIGTAYLHMSLGSLISTPESERLWR